MQKKNNSRFSKDILVFGNAKALCVAALLAAITVIIAYVCKALTVTMSVRITFENLPLILAGYILGPWVGFLTGLCADITSTATSQYGIAGINPIITFGSASVGFFSGVVSHYIIPKKSVLQIILTVFISHIMGNMFIKTLGLYFYYATPPIEIAVRCVVYVGIAVVESILLIIILKSRGITKAIGGLKL